MTVQEAHTAARHAQAIVDGCEDIDELDKASSVKQADRDCPPDFTDEMRDLAQLILLDSYLAAIGRA